MLSMNQEEKLLTQGKHTCSLLAASSNGPRVPTDCWSALAALAACTMPATNGRSKEAEARLRLSTAASIAAGSTFGVMGGVAGWTADNLDRGGGGEGV